MTPSSSTPTPESLMGAAYDAHIATIREWSDRCAALTKERDDLRRALENCKAAILDPINKESIACTVWRSPTETLVDYIDAKLAVPSLELFPVTPS